MHCISDDDDSQAGNITKDSTNSYYISQEWMGGGLFFLLDEAHFTPSSSMVL